MIKTIDTNELADVIGGQTHCAGFSVTLGDFFLCLGKAYTDGEAP